MPGRETLPYKFAPADHYDDFFNFFEAQEREKQPKPAPFSVEQHAIHREVVEDSIFLKYAPMTEINICGVYKKWTTYCEAQRLPKSWRDELKSLTVGKLLDFLFFVCERYRVTSSGSLENYMRGFQQLHLMIAARKVDENFMLRAYQYEKAVLIPLFGLRQPNIDGKPVSSKGCLLSLLVFNFAYDTGTFQGERMRVQLDSIYKLLHYNGVRAGELVNSEKNYPRDNSREILFGNKLVYKSNKELGSEPPRDKDWKAVEALLNQEPACRNRTRALCYEDILLMKIRHPQTGKSILAMAIKFTHHKGSDRKLKPMIVLFTPTKKLVWDLIIMILSLALRDKAFDAQGLEDARSVLSLVVWGPTECMQFRWKQEKLKTPIFRRIKNGEASETEAMTYADLNDAMGRQSLDAGNEKKWTPKFGRRAAGNAVNGDANDAVRDQMMRHNPKFFTFSSAYLNEHLAFDCQNAFLEEPKEDELIRLFTHVSLTRDPRVKKDIVPDTLWEKVRPTPRISELKHKRSILKGGQYRIAGNIHEDEIRQLTAEISALESKQREDIIHGYRKYYFYKRPTWDIEAQLRGETEEAYEMPAIDLALPERQRVAEILCEQSEAWTEEQYFEKEVELVDQLVALCDKKEPRRSKSTRQVHIEPDIGQELPIGEKPPALEQDHEIDLFPLQLKDELCSNCICPDCIGDSKMTIDARKFEWCRPTILNDHFDDKHLPDREAAVQRGDAIPCSHPKCSQLKFEHVDELRLHTLNIHGFKLRSSVQAERRKRKRDERRQKARRGK